MDKQGLQESLNVVEGVTHAGKTGKRGDSILPITQNNIFEKSVFEATVKHRVKL